MFEEKVLQPNQLPLPQKSRKCTDVICLILGFIFALGMLITACVFWTNGTTFEERFAQIQVFRNGRPCAKNQHVYVVHPESLENATCVKQCPNNFQSVRNLCLPENQQKRQAYLENPQVSAIFDYAPFKLVLLVAALISVSLGILWAVLVQAAPRHASLISHTLNPLLLIAFGVLSLVLPNTYFIQNHGVQIAVAVFCFILAIITIVILLVYANQVKFQGLFLDYAARFLSNEPFALLHLFIHAGILLFLVILIVWQHFCFTSSFRHSRNFYNFSSIGIWQVLNVLQFIWGARLIRDSHNFCLSANATEYYWRGQFNIGFVKAYLRLLRKHWGTVIGGSFLNAFFQIPTLLAQLFICHPGTLCSKAGVFCQNSCSFFTSFFDLVRTDSYAYTNIAGIPFCNSSRECAKICQNSKHFVGSHSPLSHYKFQANVTLTLIAFIASSIILRFQVHTVGFWNLTLLIVVIYISVTLFVGVHGDVAEALQTSYLCEHQLEPNHQRLQRLDGAYVVQLQQWERRLPGQGDGNI